MFFLSQQRRLLLTPTIIGPLTPTSVNLKVLEVVISDCLHLLLECEGLLSDRQCGFRWRRSTGVLLAVISRSWWAALDNQGEIHLVSLDISNNFDRA